MFINGDLLLNNLEKHTQLAPIKTLLVRWLIKLIFVLNLHKLVYTQAESFLYLKVKYMLTIFIAWLIWLKASKIILIIVQLVEQLAEMIELLINRKSLSVDNSNDSKKTENLHSLLASGFKKERSLQKGRIIFQS